MTKIDYLEIPEFLKLTAEQRKAAWEKHPPKVAPSGWADPKLEASEKHYKEQKREKATQRLAKLYEEHEGEYYDRKEGEWKLKTVTAR